MVAGVSLGAEVSVDPVAVDHVDLVIEALGHFLDEGGFPAGDAAGEADDPYRLQLFPQKVDDEAGQQHRKEGVQPREHELRQKELNFPFFTFPMNGSKRVMTWGCTQPFAFMR